MLVAANLLQALFAPRLSPPQPSAGEVPFTLDEDVAEIAAELGMVMPPNLADDATTRNTALKALPDAAESDAAPFPQPDQAAVTAGGDADTDGLLSGAFGLSDQIVPTPAPLLPTAPAAEAWSAPQSPVMPAPEETGVTANVEARIFAPPLPSGPEGIRPLPEAPALPADIPANSNTVRKEDIVVSAGPARFPSPPATESAAPLDPAPVRSADPNPSTASEAARVFVSTPVLPAAPEARAARNGTTAAPAVAAYAPAAMAAPSPAPPTPPAQVVASAHLLRTRPEIATTEVSDSGLSDVSVVPVDWVADIPPVPADPPALSGSSPAVDASRAGVDLTGPEAAHKHAESVVHAKAEALTRDSGTEDQGRVHVTLQRDGEGWRVVVSADNPATLDLMRRHADQLQQDLAQQGFGGAQLDFSDWKEPDTPEPPPETGSAAPAPRAEMALYLHSPLLPSSGLDLRL